MKVRVQTACLASAGLAIFTLVVVELTACTSSSTSNSSTQAPVKDNYTPINSTINSNINSNANLAPRPAIFEDEVLAAQANHHTNTEVTCTLPVKRMLPQDNKGEKHEKFILQMSNGSTILVAHNISRAPFVPISEGDLVTVHGEYIWNRKGGVIHWTHLSDTPKHPSGYIDFAGQRYQ